MEDELREFGLTEKEIKVYIALLKLGSALVQDISKKAGTYRTYTYEVLKSLKEKGLVSYVIKSGKQYFEVAQPEKLINILKEREEKIKKILPTLENIYNSSPEKPKIEVYEGKEGLKSIYDDMIKTKREILAYGSAKKQIELMQFYFPNFIKRRVKEGIKTKVIIEKSEDSLKLSKNDKKELREIKFFPKGIDPPTITNIYGDKIAMISLTREPIGIIIENEEMVNSHKIIFNLLWNISKS